MMPRTGWRAKGGKGHGTWLATLMLAAGTMGCVQHRAQSLSPLIAQGRANELSATAEHRGQRLRVWGVVVSTGLKKVDALVGRKTEPLNPYSTSVEVEQVRRTYPYLYLRDASAKADEGTLLCFFSNALMSEVGKLQPNTSIVVIGDFQEYAEGGRTLVLNTCELAGGGPATTTAAW